MAQTVIKLNFCLFLAKMLKIVCISVKSCSKMAFYKKNGLKWLFWENLFKYSTHLPKSATFRKKWLQILDTFVKIDSFWTFSA